MTTLLTGDDNATAGLATARFLFTNQPWFYQAIVDAFSEIADRWRWKQVGNATPQMAAQYGTDALVTLQIGSGMLGMIVPFAGPAANIPTGSLLCDGSAVSQATYPDLYALIGTTYGPALGGNFTLPDLRGKTVIGVGTGSGLTPRALNDQLGEEVHYLSINEMPSHTHTINLNTAIFPVGAGAPTPAAHQNFTNITGSAGGNAGHNNMQPSVALNYIIMAML